MLVMHERLRAVLDFPEVIDSGDWFERPRRVQGPERKRPVAPDDSVAAGDDVSRRIDQLATRMEALAWLVESLFDRVEHSVSSAGRLTPRQRRGTSSPGPVGLNDGNEQAHDLEEILDSRSHEAYIRLLAFQRLS